MKKILIITDSISMPRNGVPYEDTWISMLKRKYPGCDFIDRPARGTTSMRLVTEGGGGVDLLETYQPDAVILQFGTAECAPRLFRKSGFEYFVMNRIMTPAMRERYIRRVKKKRARNPDMPDIPPEIFEMNIRNYLDRAERLSTRVYAFLVPRAANLFIEKSPYMQKNINAYNAIYRMLEEEYEILQCIEPFGPDVDVNMVTTDELHINREGNLILLEKAERALGRFLHEASAGHLARER